MTSPKPTRSTKTIRNRVGMRSVDIARSRAQTRPIRCLRRRASPPGVAKQAIAENKGESLPDRRGSELEWLRRRTKPVGSCDATGKAWCLGADGCDDGGRGSEI